MADGVLGAEAAGGVGEDGVAGEVDELEKALGDLAREGGNVARYLQQEGFRDYVVRRWIALEFVPPREGA